MSTILVQKSTKTNLNADVQQSARQSVTDTETAHTKEQLATISLLLHYNIDNTLNRLMEHSRVQQQQQQHDQQSSDMPPARVNVEIISLPAATTVAASNVELEVADIVSKGELNGGCCMPPTPPVTPSFFNTAQKRWRILAKALRKDSEETVSSSSDEFTEEQTASVRRFKSFDLLRQDSFEDHVSLKCLGKTENWYKYRMQLKNDVEFSVNIHHMERQLTANDLMGFNNTGNICVWPSEEALTALVLSELAAYRGKWILELGGGFTSLAGLMLAKYAKPYAVHLTDGNEVSVENVKKTVCLNELSCYTKCSVLKWQETAARAQADQYKFDFILCADCLFFDEARSALVDTIWYYLAPQGVALIMAPQRGHTLNVFRDECMASGFAVDLAVRYNETIWQRHLQLKADSALYDEDLHYPLLLQLRKPQS